MTVDPELAAIQQFFAVESAENLALMEDALLRLEDSPADAELLATVFRVAHTIKGDAGNLGLTAVADLAHVLEDLLDRMREGTLAVSPERIELVLRATDAFRELIPAAVAGAQALTPSQRELGDEIAASARDEETRTAAGPALPADAAQPVAGVAPARRARTLRVEVERLDRALDLLGEMAIARGRVEQMLADGRPAREVLAAHRDADPLHAALQEVVMRLRMVPLGPVLAPFRRTVRDVAFANGRLARLEVQGEEVEVDTSLVEPLRDALTHMVRNAVDHGIEPPEARLQAGKDPQGVIHLTAGHEGGSIVVRMRDDGAGLDRARIERRAREAGLCAEPERLADGELYRLLFEPGFSTASRVTDLSGRGVGLDVVRRNMEALRGSVSIDSTPGAGTTLTLRLPLTLALIEGFSIGVGGDTYVIPLDAVVECVDLPADRSDAGAEGVISLRGQPLPFVRMRHVLGVDGAPPPREGVVIVRHEGEQAGLVVDALLGENQAVIKPLGRLFHGLPQVSGCTILGSGRVALILDVAAVLAESMRRGAAVPALN
ncbi:MAG TPA: chemotaxis protein CheA [Longimicrobium sp.]|jgi:two-component system chemotaxis sensor kinase CheA|uniref:chemotaxis protein CheA n=1 Tax=Longimicrobium sp. TaxID=2029185 RepID=UPI002EDB5F68